VAAGISWNAARKRDGVIPVRDRQVSDSGGREPARHSGDHRIRSKCRSHYSYQVRPDEYVSGSTVASAQP
jgi:hypothetical protein